MPNNIIVKLNILNLGEAWKCFGNKLPGFVSWLRRNHFLQYFIKNPLRYFPLHQETFRSQLHTWASSFSKQRQIILTAAHDTFKAFVNLKRCRDLTQSLMIHPFLSPEIKSHNKWNAYVKSHKAWNVNVGFYGPHDLVELFYWASSALTLVDVMKHYTLIIVCVWV